MAESFMHDNPFVWHPSPEIVENANLTGFMKLHKVDHFDDLWKRSTDDIAWFTDALLRYLDIRFYTPYTQVLDLSQGIAWPTWCVGGEMNIVHNCLDKYMDTHTENKLALIWEGEDGQVRRLSYGDLNRLVNQTANALRKLGINKGDVVGLYMPMVPENIAAFLAIAKIGAIVLPLFSGFGPGALVTRLADAEAKALLTADGYYRRGNLVDMKQTVDEAAQEIPSLQHVILYEFAGNPIDWVPGRDYSWENLVLTQDEFAPTEITSAEDPLMILYTSGTTGKPKGAVHTHCGFPVKATQDMAFGTDVHPEDIIHWVTDMGWMMGPWLTFGSLLLGASFFIYDGAPDYPHSGRLWEMVDRHKISKLGISPTLIRALIPSGEEAVRSHDLSSLKLIASTGEPWNPDPWNWLFQVVGVGRIPIINYTGGTELSGGILMSNPLFPIKPCAISAPCPGMRADILDEDGNSVRGQVGELVIKAPWIGMTRGFWNDQERYLDTYWSRWSNIWVHGDWAFTDSDGQWYILGRSDDTIKIAGKRLGPAEIESILISHPAVVESAAIGVPDPIKGNQLVVFCVLAPDEQPTEELRTEFKDLVRRNQGKSLTPSQVFFVSDLPKTRNAKVMRRMVRAAYLNQDPGDTTSLVNPETIDEIRTISQESLRISETGQ